mmetsp:Transcript_2619/g.3789  ORF Transcript_2619/g.3789 Transcript_2619/m.3789 type:complete len:391 (-) Transcript_2619:229-1401(-)
MIHNTLRNQFHICSNYIRTHSPDKRRIKSQLVRCNSSDSSKSPKKPSALNRQSLAARSTEKVQEVLSQTNVEANIGTILENTNIRKNMKTIGEHVKHVDENKLQKDVMAFQKNVKKKLSDEFEIRFPSVSERWKLIRDSANERRVIMDDFWWKWNIAIALMPVIIIAIVCESMKPEMEEYYEGIARNEEHRLMVEQGGVTLAQSGIQKRVEEKLIAEWSKKKRIEEMADGCDDDSLDSKVMRRLYELEQYLRNVLDEQILPVLGFSKADKIEEYETNNEVTEFEKSSHDLGVYQVMERAKIEPNRDDNLSVGIIPERVEKVTSNQTENGSVDKGTIGLRKDQTLCKSNESNGDQGVSVKTTKQRGSLWRALHTAFTINDKSDDEKSKGSG